MGVTVRLGRFILAVLGTSVLILATGCSGHQAIVPPSLSNVEANSTVNPASSGRAAETSQKHAVGHGGEVPAPIDPDHAPYAPRRVHLREVSAPALTAAQREAQLAKLFEAGRHSMSVVNEVKGGGQGGFYWNWGQFSNDGNVWVAQDAVPPDPNGNAIRLPSPVNCNDASDIYCGNYLYAPTIHGSNGNCLEVMSDYQNTQNSLGYTNYYLMIQDWCYQSHPGTAFAHTIPLDSNFFDNYVRVYSNADGRPQYIAEVAKDSANVWHFYLYNNLLQRYDDIYQSSGVSAESSGNGWSIIELRFGNDASFVQNLPCPSLPNVGASGVRLHSSSGWQLINGGSLQPVLGSGTNDCFGFNSTNPPDYYILYPTQNVLGYADSAWYARDPYNGQNPSTLYTQSGSGVPIGGGGGGSTGGGGGCTRCPPTQ